MGASSNPFSACFVRPGAIRWLDTGDVPSVPLLVQKIGAARAWQVIGAHGSGKSTLLSHLATELERQGIATALVRRAHGSRRRSLTAGAGVLLVDEWSSLPRATRLAVRWLCRLRGATLIVACHRDVGFATLLHTRITPALARGVVTEVAGEPFATGIDVQALIARHGHDLRELLFDLYDDYEAAAR